MKQIIQQRIHVPEKINHIPNVPVKVSKWFTSLAVNCNTTITVAQLEEMMGLAAFFSVYLDVGIESLDDLYTRVRQKVENLLALELFDGVHACVRRHNNDKELAEFILFFPHPFAVARARKAIAYAKDRIWTKEPEYLPFQCCMCPSSDKPDAYTCPKGDPCRFVKIYVDDRGWKYRVMGDLAGTYKARYQKPQYQGETGWKGVGSMQRLPTFEQAQGELNAMAQRKGWLELGMGTAG